MTRNLGILLLIIGLALAFAVFPVFYITLLTYIGMYSLVALGLVLITGVCGITSFGQAAFVGIAAYTTGYMATELSLSPWLGLVASLGITGLAAVLIGMATLKLSGHYLPLSTLAWGIALFFVFGNLSFLGGHTGLGGIPPISIGPLVIDTIHGSFSLTWAFVCLSLLGLTNLLRSGFGRSLYAVRGDAAMAESFGINAFWTKLIAFTIAALLAALSGWLYAHTLRFVNPTPFNLHIGIEYLFMAVVGGVGYVWGALIGAAIITIAKQVLQDVVPDLIGTSGNLELVFLGAGMVILLQYAKGGVLGAIRGRSEDTGYRYHEDAGTETLRGRSQSPKTDKPVLEVQGITKNFGGLIAVDEVSFEVPHGEIVGLIGPNGAGKSTMFNLISGLLVPTRGQVLLDGRDVSKLSADKIARLGLARSFQHVHLLSRMSVLENVMIGAHLRRSSSLLSCLFGLDADDEKKVQAEAMMQLERVGLKDLALQPAGTLALGQQRLLEIARALCADPTLLLLDEPAAGLRHFEKNALADVLRDLKENGLSVLIVEHDMRFISDVVDRMVVMDFGTRIAMGEPTAVRSNPKVIEAYLGVAE